MSGDNNEATIRLQAVTPKSGRHCPALVVGHYCHDRIILPGGSRVDALGGSVSYIINVFEALGVNAEVVSKVGPDFIYSSQLSHLPHIVESQSTTEFFADFTTGEERSLKVGNICEPIYPHDILSHQKYELGLAVGIAGEVLPETLERMVESSRIVVADVQALIRTINPQTGLVSLQRLEDTPYQSSLHRISFLKAARNEASFIDIEQVKQLTCVIVTEGKNGSRVYNKENDFKVPPFPATEVDPTGAGDCFLAGFSAGLYQGLSVYQAVLMGNYFGALAVEQIGVPHFTEKQLQKLQEIRDMVVGDMHCKVWPMGSEIPYSVQKAEGIKIISMQQEVGGAISLSLLGMVYASPSVSRLGEGRGFMNWFFEQ